MMGVMLPLLGDILGTVIDRVFPDKEAADKAKLEAMAILHKETTTELKAARDIIVAEARSESWMARNWRPITMLCFVAIIMNNYILVPYFALFGLPNIYLELPVDVWQIIKIGLGGYVVGRSFEKTAKVWKEKGA